MGKKSKRKSSEVISAIQDTPKKIKLEKADKSKTGKKGHKIKHTVNKNNDKNTVKQTEKKKVNTSDNNKSTTQTNQFVIPKEFAQHLNKRKKQAISRKVRNLIKIREARGEEMTTEVINKLVKEVIDEKSGKSNKEQEGTSESNTDVNNKMKNKQAIKGKKKGKQFIKT